MIEPFTGSENRKNWGFRGDVYNFFKEKIFINLNKILKNVLLIPCSTIPLDLSFISYVD